MGLEIDGDIESGTSDNAKSLKMSTCNNTYSRAFDILTLCVLQLIWMAYQRSFDRIASHFASIERKPS